MPELAEVERCRRTLSQHCVGKQIAGVTAAIDDIVYCNSKSSEFERVLTGRVVLQCVRKGKYVWLEMNGEGPCVMFHLGMTGNFYVKGETDVLHLTSESKYSVTDAWPPKATKCLLKMTDDTEIAFINTRRLGRIRLEIDPWKCATICKLGFDAYTDLPPLAEFSQLLRRRKGPIKSVLLDQSFAAGLGNWLADEILYHSVMHPQEATATLSDEQVLSIYTSITYVVTTACDANADATKFPPHWMFHSRWSKKTKGALDFHGRKIDFVTVGGRTSAFIPSAQKLVKGLAKIVRTGSSKTSTTAAPTPAQTDSPQLSPLISESDTKTDIRRLANETKGRDVTTALTNTFHAIKSRRESTTTPPAAVVKKRRTSPETQVTTGRRQTHTRSSKDRNLGEPRTHSTRPAEDTDRLQSLVSVVGASVADGSDKRPLSHAAANAGHGRERPVSVTATFVPAVKGCTLSSIRELSFQRRRGRRKESTELITNTKHNPRQSIPSPQAMQQDVPKAFNDPNTCRPSEPADSQSRVSPDTAGGHDTDPIQHSAHSSIAPGIACAETVDTDDHTTLNGTSRYFPSNNDPEVRESYTSPEGAGAHKRDDRAPIEHPNLVIGTGRARGANLSAFVRRSQRTKSARNTHSVEI